MVGFHSNQDYTGLKHVQLDQRIVASLEGITKCSITKNILTSPIVSFYPCQHKANSVAVKEFFGPLNNGFLRTQKNCPRCKVVVLTYAPDPVSSKIARIIFSNEESFQADPEPEQVVELRNLRISSTVISLWPCNHKINESMALNMFGKTLKPNIIFPKHVNRTFVERRVCPYPECGVEVVGYSPDNYIREVAKILQPGSNIAWRRSLNDSMLFRRLPDALFPSIFKFIDRDSFRKLECVSKFFKIQVNEEAAWIEFAKQFPAVELSDQDPTNSTKTVRLTARAKVMAKYGEIMKDGETMLKLSTASNSIDTYNIRLREVQRDSNRIDTLEPFWKQGTPYERLTKVLSTEDLWKLKFNLDFREDYDYLYDLLNKYYAIPNTKDQPFEVEEKLKRLTLCLSYLAGKDKPILLHCPNGSLLLSQLITNKDIQNVRYLIALGVNPNISDFDACLKINNFDTACEMMKTLLRAKILPSELRLSKYTRLLRKSL